MLEVRGTHRLRLDAGCSMLDTGCLPGGRYFGRQRRLPYWMLDFGMWNADLSFRIYHFTFLIYLTASPFLRVILLCLVPSY